MARLSFLLFAALASVTTAFVQPSLNTRTATASVADVVPSVAQTQSTTQSQLNAMLKEREMTEKYYIPKAKETPKVLGGVKIGLRKLVVITGASSGLGLNAAIKLAQSGNYFVVMACRDVEKAKRGEFIRSIICLR